MLVPLKQRPWAHWCLTQLPPLPQSSDTWCLDAHPNVAPLNMVVSWSLICFVVNMKTNVDISSLSGPGNPTDLWEKMAWPENNWGQQDSLPLWGLGIDIFSSSFPLFYPFLIQFFNTLMDKKLKNTIWSVWKTICSQCGHWQLRVCIRTLWEKLHLFDWF
jgi:hypothetical protein